MSRIVSVWLRKLGSCDRRWRTETAGLNTLFLTPEEEFSAERKQLCGSDGQSPKLQHSLNSIHINRRFISTKLTVDHMLHVGETSAVFHAQTNPPETHSQKVKMSLFSISRGISEHKEHFHWNGRIWKRTIFNSKRSGALNMSATGDTLLHGEHETTFIQTRTADLCQVRHAETWLSWIFWLDLSQKLDEMNWSDKLLEEKTHYKKSCLQSVWNQC